MSVWCIVRGSVQKPYKTVSIRRLVDELFDEHTRLNFVQGVKADTFDFAFCDDGMSAAFTVNVFCEQLRQNNIHSDIVAEVRFLT